VNDARFRDGDERPLRLKALAPDDLAVISALLQDSLGETDRAAWMPRRRRFCLLLNRFRWEDAAAARRQGRPYERVLCLLTVENAMRVRATGVDPADPELVISPLAIAFEPGEDPAGVVRLTLAGDGEVAIDVECLEVTLVDTARPHRARAGQPPEHPDAEPG